MVAPANIHKPAGDALNPSGAIPPRPRQSPHETVIGGVQLLRRDQGATLADLMAATSWQAHSVRGALAGAVRQHGFTVASSKPDGVRVYRIVGEPAR